MDASSEVKRLRARIRTGYVLWIFSLLGLLALAHFYRESDPLAAGRTGAASQAELARSRLQIETLSADLLRNQRDLRNAQKDFLQLNTDYKNAMEEIKRLQAHP